jgi:hypothetical protein
MVFSPQLTQEQYYQNHSREIFDKQNQYYYFVFSTIKVSVKAYTYSKFCWRIGQIVNKCWYITHHSEPSKTFLACHKYREQKIQSQTHNNIQFSVTYSVQNQ